jgi:hypothetical protein
MLASTVQFSTNDQPTTHRPHTHPQPRPVCKTRPCLAAHGTTAPLKAPKDNPQHVRLFLQDPTGCSPPPTSRTNPTFHHNPRETRRPCVLAGLAAAGRELASVSAIEHPATTSGQRGLLTPLRVKVLLRKEVIQPHLPVRLPCYDFVPIASPTFDGSLPDQRSGLGHRLRVLPTFVT